MNFPGVVAGDEEMLARINAAGSLHVDGHSPGVSGRALDAYVAASVESDHEATELEEAEEKRRKGMWVFLRQGSASQNLVDLAPTIVVHGTDLAALCTDDREPDTLLKLGHINDCVRLAVGPWVPDHVWQAGHLVARGGEIETGAVSAAPVPELLRDTVNIGRLPSAEDLVLDLAPGTCVRAIGVESHSLTTSGREIVLGEDDVAHAAVVERHHATGRIGRGFATGFGLRCRAIASTVAHDAHNVVCIGASGEDMAVAVARLAELGGGQLAVLRGRVVAEVALPLAGLMSDCWPGWPCSPRRGSAAPPA